MAFKTHGWPDQAGAMTLRNTINRNMNVRTVAFFTDVDGRKIPRGSISGVIGGPPSQRGVGGVVLPSPVVVSPVIVPPVVVPVEVAPPVVASPMQYPAQQFQPWLLPIKPVTFTFRVLGAAIDAFVFGPIPGPVYLHHMWAVDEIASGDPNITTLLLRVDISDHGGTDTFTYGAGSYPVGLSTAPYTIFEYNLDSGEHLLPGLRKGWAWLTPTGLTNVPGWHWDLRRFIDLPQVYIKVYTQQESVTDGTFHLDLWLSDSISMNGGVVSLNEIVPRLRCPTGQHQHGQETYCRH
jgi:hypothetical protein